MTKKIYDISYKTIILMNADPEESADIAFLVKEAGLDSQAVTTPSELKKKMKGADVLAVIMDLDSVEVDNRSIKEIALQFPAIPFLCISKERFHPELKDSIRDHIYACLTKPIDPEELSYWLKCIQEDDRSLTVG